MRFIPLRCKTARNKINFGHTRSFSSLSLDITQKEGKNGKPSFAIEGFVSVGCNIKAC